MFYLLFFLFSIASSAFASCEIELEAPVDNISGGFMGVGIGYGLGPVSVSSPSKVDTSIQTSAFGRTASYYYSNSVPSTAALSGFIANFNTGYNWQLGQSPWVLGFIGGGSLTTLMGRSPFASVLLSTQAGGTATNLWGTTESAKITDEGDFEAGIRFGHVFNRTFLFFHGGWAIHRLVFHSPQISARVPQWFNFCLVGLGIDVRLTRNTIVGIALDTHVGMQSHFSFMQTSTRNSVRLYMRPVIAQGLVTAKYFFPVRRGAQ